VVLQAEPIQSSPAATADWHRIFLSLPDEHDYDVREVVGRLPEGLVGTLYRNGPAKNEVGGKPYAHLFDGDGMLSQFTFADGRVHYRNRFVRTTHYLAERAADKPLYRGFGTQKPGGVLANALRFPANVANTSVTFHAGNLLALWEGGKPWRLDPDTLDTVGEYDYDGELKAAYAFSAHPKIDPATGELFNFGVQYGPRTRIRSYRVDRAGRLHHLRPVTLPYPVMNHDFALTEKHLVFVIDPILVSPVKMLLGLDSFDGTLRFDRSKSTRIVLVPRDGGEPRTAELEPFFHFHFNNAYEDGRDTVIDLVRYDDYSLGDSLRDFGTAGFRERGTLWRLRVGPGGTAAAEELCPWKCEFPQHDWRRTSARHRYGYVAAGTEDVIGQAIVKIDHQEGTWQEHDFGDGQVAGEPIFVPRSTDAAEDDGWVLSVVYSAAEHRSRLVVLDARDIEREPLAVAHLRHHVPLGFHGTFTSRVAAVNGAQ
jgi:all-trans-8'-apo-beta-carotenal 15,15'-oxygenase